MMYKNFRQKWLVKSRNLSEEKKNPPRAQIFRYFRIESQKNEFILKIGYDD